MKHVMFPVTWRDVN